MKPSPEHAAGPRLLRLDQAFAQPWRNGGGLTRELLAAPPGPDWHWRISVAEVGCDGPFSPYAGVMRWFAVLRGEGVRLDFDGEVVPLHPGDAPLSFEGTDAPHCHLQNGPTQDLNLMLRHGVAGGLVRAHPGVTWHACAAHGGLYSLVPGVLHADDDQWPVPADTLCWFDEVPPRLRFEAPDDALAFWLAVGEPRVAP